MSIRVAVLRIAGTFLAALTSAVPASASGLMVRYENPGQFTDAATGAYGTADTRVLATIERHLRGLADRCLPPTAYLEIQVTDIDLAGRSDGTYARAGSAVRVMSEATWPRMDVTYVLAWDGKNAVEVRERISDMNYLWNSVRARYESEPLPYERAMLTTWFEGRFCRS